MEGEGKKVHSASDTRYQSVEDGDDEEERPMCPVFKEIGEWFGGFDLVMILIGGLMRAHGAQYWYSELRTRSSNVVGKSKGLFPKGMAAHVLLRRQGPAMTSGNGEYAAALSVDERVVNPLSSRSPAQSEVVTAVAVSSSRPVCTVEVDVQHEDGDKKEHIRISTVKSLSSLRRAPFMREGRKAQGTGKGRTRQHASWHQFHEHGNAYCHIVSPSMRCEYWTFDVGFDSDEAFEK
ncbi:uncharacterized protein EV420DRAFT_1482269 [Desarmillaria tabescens]|uniref:Uncharacterized protein n=1 Tax=Armillaria tabescens TaxID=1929756 RepID=A0AA39K0A4_ARMTA|nr:uncharacterized protein EV420DRAFT_1482269 [Desarmillaria tabescens]KAK0452185.1 hypothetical protein EV420DRAFT_1482269 [Desarmillaria tabescens]